MPSPTPFRAQLPRGVDPNDPRVQRTLEAIRLVAAQKKRAPSVADYQDYYKNTDPSLPALTTIYRLFGSWPDLLAAAGVETADDDRARASDEELIADMRQAARDLGTTVLSTHAYDEYRKTNQRAQDHPFRNPADAKTHSLRSSSAIRKWLGKWEEAVPKAGLEAPQRAAPRKPTAPEALHALRIMTRRAQGQPLTPQLYSQLASQAAGEVPDIQQILSLFPSWEAALRAADVEVCDDLHPTALWTVAEARAVLQNMQRIIRAEYPDARVTRSRYELLRSKSRRPLPTWQVLCDLVGPGGPRRLNPAA